MNRLKKYDFKIFHKLFKNSYINIVDNLSRMSIRLLFNSRQKDFIRSTIKIIKILIKANQVSNHQIQKLFYSFKTFESISNKTIKYKKSSMYYQLIKYLKRNKIWLTTTRVFRNKKKTLKNQTKFFHQNSNIKLLYFIEINNQRSICLTKSKVQKFLKTTHENHEHFAFSLTLNYFINRVYWSTKIKNVETWVQSCHLCQIKLKKPIKSDAFVIQKFNFMTMIDMNFMKSIFSACIATEVIYILLMMNYFTKFVWVKAYLTTKNETIINMLRDHIVLMFDWSKSVYSDNESYFVNNNVHAIYLEHEINQFTKSMSLSLFIELLKRTIQMLLILITKSCVNRKTINSWSLKVRNYVLIINIKAIKIHEYQSAQLMLRFESKRIHFNIESSQISNSVLTFETLLNH